jgi:hypothetical protein
MIIITSQGSYYHMKQDVSIESTPKTSCISNTRETEYSVDRLQFMVVIVSVDAM